MPIHDYYCGWCDEVEERFVCIEDLYKSQRCHCGLEMERIFLKVPMVFVRKDIHYNSPVDGRPITSEQAHRDELARTDTVVYEPGIKQDQERNERRRAEALERSIDATVEKEIATMPGHKRERLASELENGASAEPIRTGK